MPAADGVDALGRRRAARWLPARARRGAHPRPGGSLDHAHDVRHPVGGHPARAARVLRALQAMEGEGWVALSGVPRPGGGPPVDHLVIGPGGIVVVDSRVWVGRIEVTRGVVQQNGFWRERETAEVARTAGALASLLPPAWRTAVHAVICVAQHDLAEHVVAPGVRVVGVTALAGTLRALPARLEPTEIIQLCTQLRHLLVERETPQLLTTAELDGCLPFDRRTGHLGSLEALTGRGLAVPVAGATWRSAARSAGRRQAPRRRRPLRNVRRLLAGDEGRFLPAARVLLAVLALLALVFVGPALVHRLVDAGSGRPAAPVLPVAPSGEVIVPAAVPALGASTSRVVTFRG